MSRLYLKTHKKINKIIYYILVDTIRKIQKNTTFESITECNFFQVHVKFVIKKKGKPDEHQGHQEKYEAMESAKKKIILD